MTGPITIAKPDCGFHQYGTDFETRVFSVQNEIRANHEMPPLTFDRRHSDEFTWFNAVGKVIWEMQHGAS